MSEYKIDHGIPSPINTWNDLVNQMGVGDSVFVKDCEADSVKMAINNAGYKTTRKGEDCGWRIWKLQKISKDK